MMIIDLIRLTHCWSACLHGGLCSNTDV